MFSQIVEQAPFGVYVVDSELRIRATNTTSQAAAAGDLLIGRDLSEIMRSMWPEPVVLDAIDRFRQTLATGEPYEARLSDTRGDSQKTESYNWHIQRLTLPDSTYGVVCYFYDITPILEAEAAMAAAAERDAFLLVLNDRLRPLSDPLEIQAQAVRVLGEHLGVEWAHYAEYDEALTFATIRCSYTSGNVPSLDGRHSLAEFGAMVEALAAGRTVVIPDLQQSPFITPKAWTNYGSMGMRTLVCAPVVKGGRLIANIGVNGREVRVWTPQEIALIEATAERTWAAVGRAWAEENLRDRENRLQLALEASGMGTFVWKIDEDCLEPDSRLLALFGLPSNGTLSSAQSMAMRVCADDRARYTEAVARAIDPAGTGTLREEVRVQLPDGTKRWLAISARTQFETSDAQPQWGSSAHRAVRMSGTAVDVTDHTHREANLANDLHDTMLLQTLSAQLIEEQDSPSMYERLVGAAASIMRSDTASLQMLDTQRGTGGELRLIAAQGFSAETMRTFEWVSLKASTSCGAALRSRARVIVPDVERADFMSGTPDQARCLHAGIRAAQTTPLVSRSGKLLGMISTHWAEPHQPSERDLRLLDILARQAADIIERTQAEEALRRNEIQLKEADRRKDEFLAVLAHELRNPLAPLRTGLELIRLAGDTPGAVESVRTMMETEVTHMVRLIDDLLDVSRITSGKIRLQRQPTPLGALVNTAIEFNRSALDEARVSLRVDIPEVPIVLDVDPTRFVQVLSNVFHNAVKFTDEGGQISIAAVLPETDGREVREVSLVVTDSGVGISSHMLPRVFDLFTQGDATTHRAYGGLGIGLALARQLIEMHGGSIEGHSDGPGRGSTFTIRMPLATAAEVLPSATRSNAPAGLGRNVVVIDDNVNAARALQRLVTALGGRCAVAYDGESGLASIRESNPDVVLLDIGMPGIDGYEVCRRIRSDMGPRVFVVAMTGWGQERDKLEAMRAGFDLHLTKPADPNVLEALLLGQRPAATAS